MLPSPRLIRASPDTERAAERNAIRAGKVRLSVMAFTTVEALESALTANALVIAEAEALAKLLAKDIAKARREARADAREAKAVARNNAAILAERACA